MCHVTLCARAESTRGPGERVIDRHGKQESIMEQVINHFAVLTSRSDARSADFYTDRALLLIAAHPRMG